MNRWLLLSQVWRYILETEPGQRPVTMSCWEGHLLQEAEVGAHCRTGKDSAHCPQCSGHRWWHSHCLRYFGLRRVSTHSSGQFYSTTWPGPSRGGNPWCLQTCCQACAIPVCGRELAKGLLERAPAIEGGHPWVTAMEHLSSRTGLSLTDTSSADLPADLVPSVVGFGSPLHLGTPHQHLVRIHWTTVQ